MAELIRSLTGIRPDVSVVGIGAEAVLANESLSAVVADQLRHDGLGRWLEPETDFSEAADAEAVPR